ncbi:MAG: hypothetical protein ACOXZH_00665 [Bacteroidales bacterium]|jgi:hypothetical protein|nr:hypothetical protein [Bacteroidales bacterium]
MSKKEKIALFAGGCFCIITMEVFHILLFILSVLLDNNEFVNIKRQYNRTAFL